MNRLGRILLFITAAIAIVVTAIPSDTRNGFALHPARSCSPHLRSPASRPGLWVRLRDYIIEAIWGVPGRYDKSATGRKQLTYKSPASSSRTRYGDDVVLRFFIRSASEASALAEASAILFLDVWTSTGEWVDIRLAKDVVRAHLQRMKKASGADRTSFHSGPISPWIVTSLLTDVACTPNT